MKKTVLFWTVCLLTVHLCAFTVIIDPGHGGNDLGAFGTYAHNGKEITVYEKDIVLSIAEKLADTIQKRYPEMQVVLTREDDKQLSLQARRKKIAALSHGKESISLSIHTNTAGIDKNRRGFEIRAGKDGLLFAQYLAERLKQAVGTQLPNNGVHDVSASPFTADILADIVLDIGFLSHPDDAALLISDAFLDRVTLCIAESIQDFYRK